MPRLFQENDLRKELIKRLKRQGTQSSLAREIGISHSYLNDILKGKRQITGPVASYLGFERCTVFKRQRG
jgi:plasmid maintenance system antidote protein VapI